MAKKRILKKKSKKTKSSKINKEISQKEKIVAVEEIQELGSHIDPEIDKVAKLVAEAAVEGLENNFSFCNPIYRSAYMDHVCELAPLVAPLKN